MAASMEFLHPRANKYLIGMLTSRGRAFHRSLPTSQCLKRPPKYWGASRLPSLGMALPARGLSQSICRLTQHSEEVSVPDPDLVDNIAVLQDFEEKPPGFMAARPVDDVYMVQHYPPELLSFHEAMNELRAQDSWAHCRRPERYRDRTVTIGMVLDMTMEKKKKVLPFQNMVILPHAFKEENKVLCFAEGGDIQAAKDAGAFMAGGEEIVAEIQARRLHIRSFDFCVATPDMMPSLSPLKQGLRKRFPNSKRGSVSNNILAMLNLYRRGQEYKVQSRTNTINCSIGKLSLTNDQLEENMTAIISDVCSHKPLEFGPLIKQLVVTAFLLDGHKIQFEKYLPVASEDAKLAEELARLEEED